MNVSSWLRQASKTIQPLDAEIFILTTLGLLDKSELVLRGERELTSDELEMLQMMVELRLKNVPVAYITGKKEFYGREFKVAPDVLIPRPETEALINIVKELSSDGQVIVDVGTGSGCIAITLALETNTKLFGIDISPAALNIARENAERLGASVDFISGDLLANYRGEKPDIVVANLPYVDKSWEWTSPELKYEPEVALFSEDGGLFEIKRLIRQAAKLGVEILALEADPSQHEKIIDFAKKYKYNLAKQSGFCLVFMV